MSSERVNVRSMTPQEMADYTYGFVRRKYQAVVSEAEALRQQMLDRHLNQVLNKFASEKTQQKLEKDLGLRESKGVIVAEAQKTIDLAMAGLFRIGHVHSNSMASKFEGFTRSLNLLRASSWYLRHESPLAVKRTTDVVFETIHENPIYWRGEIAQDHLRTLILEGEENVVEKAFPLISRIALDIEGLRKSGDGQDNEYTDKRTAGMCSSIAMLHAQIGRAAKDSDRMDLALEAQLESHKISPNYHRLATLALWTFWVAFPLNRSAMGKAGKILKDILNSDNHSEAESAIKQFNKGRGKLGWLTSIVNNHIFRLPRRDT